ncbi:MAG: HNH endonuclease [Gammaproteobacteria bacterium]|nr:HNH endonuclease [Gammaproteobacteria bacterium]
MKYTKEQLRKIYNRTDGGCHICHKKLSFCNYGKISGRAPWEIEHSSPRSRGGTDHLNNLYAACPSCNRSKGNNSTKNARQQFGNTHAPLSKNKKQVIRRKNTAIGGMLGTVAAVALATGPIGLAFLATSGALLGNSLKPRQK